MAESSYSEWIFNQIFIQNTTPWLFLNFLHSSSNDVTQSIQQNDDVVMDNAKYALFQLDISECWFEDGGLSTFTFMLTISNLSLVSNWSKDLSFFSIFKMLVILSKILTILWRMTKKVILTISNLSWFYSVIFYSKFYELIVFLISSIALLMMLPKVYNKMM